MLSDSAAYLTRSCLTCGLDISTRHHSAKFCFEHGFSTKLMEERFCVGCGSKVPFGTNSKYCSSDCYRHIRNERKRLVRLDPSHPTSVREKEYRKSEAGMAASKRWYTSDRGRVFQREYTKRWRKTTEKGALIANRGHLSHRSFDYNSFIKFRAKLHAAKGPCAICGIPYEEGFQVDHISPIRYHYWFRYKLAEYGIEYISNPDDESNLQLICRPCHNVKSKADTAMIREFKISAGIPQRGVPSEF